MSDYEIDQLASILLEDTYCKKHYGLWPHECGCEQEDMDEEEKRPMKNLIGLATFKQKRFLTYHEIPFDKKLTKQQASDLIQEKLNEGKCGRCGRRKKDPAVAAFVGGGCSCGLYREDY